VSESDPHARTLEAYEQGAARYRERTGWIVMEAWLERLVAEAPPGPVLEIGSAHGRDADHLERSGRRVHRTDAASAFVEMQRAAGHVAEVLDVLTDDLQGPYAAVLANAVLLHFQPDEVRRVLGRIRAALAPAGLLAFTVKVGHGAEWSSAKLGAPRFFQYWQPEPLRELVTESGYEVVALEVDPGEPRDWIRVLARPTERDLGAEAVALRQVRAFPVAVVAAHSAFAASSADAD